MNLEKNKISLKHLQINKANTVIVSVTALAAFILVFTGFAVHAMLNIRDYQVRVIDQKEETRDILIDNLDVAQTINQSYQAFVAPPENIIGGARDGESAQDGDNARLILDALPSQYDFPALITSIEAMLESEGVTIGGITGTDQELSSSDAASDDPIPIPFGFSATGDYEQTQSLVDSMQQSIRPLRFQRIDIRADSSDNIRLDGTLSTFFQPEKVFRVERQNLQP